MAEGGVDARLERLREVVLEALGLGVHLVPGEPERLHQVELEQAVVADDLERGLRPGLRERDAVVRLVAHEPTPASRLIIAVADAAVTPSRSASALVLTLPVRSSIQIAFR